MATVPTMHTFATGEVVTAANLNNNTTAALNFLLSGKPIASMRQTLTQTLVTNNNTAITFDTELIDRDNGHSNVTNTSRYTAQTAGWYWCAGSVVFDNTQTTGKRQAVLRVNGTSMTTNAGGPASGYSAFSVAGLLYLNVGDYVEVWGFQNGTANMSTSTSDGGSWLHVLWESI